MNDQVKTNDQSITTTESNWKILFIAAILFLIGITYLSLQIASMIKTNTGGSPHDEGFIRFNRSELFSDIRSWITIVMSLSGATLLLLRRKLGWIFAVSVLLVFITISGAGLIVTFNLRMIFSFVIVLVAEAVLILALVFCLQPAFRKKMLTDKKHYLSAFALTAILFTVYFILQ